MKIKVYVLSGYFLLIEIFAIAAICRFPIECLSVQSFYFCKEMAMSKISLLYSFLFAFLVCAVAQATEPVINGRQSDFLRITRDQSGEELFLETAIVRYKCQNDNTIVDLVGVVHIGERGYYRRLNSFLGDCDVVLYELVAPEGTKVTKDREASNVISMIQEMMQSTLGLEGQLKHIDYQQENFVHADLSPQKLQEKMSERGDTPLTLAMEAILQMMRDHNKRSDQSEIALAAENIDLLAALSGPQDAAKLKRMLASQFNHNDLTAGPMGGNIGKLILDDRNAYCMKVLQEQVAKNKKADNGKKHYAIFYGAAHLPDMHNRLVKEFRMHPTEIRWMKAWDLRTQDQKYEAAQN